MAVRRIGLRRSSKESLDPAARLHELARRSSRQWKAKAAREGYEPDQAGLFERKKCPGGKVRITFRVLLTRQQAEALAARAIQEENSK